MKPQSSGCWRTGLRPHPADAAAINVGAAETVGLRDSCVTPAGECLSSHAGSETIPAKELEDLKSVLGFHDEPRSKSARFSTTTAKSTSLVMR